MFFAKATQLGYFNNKRLRENDIFVIRPKPYLCPTDKVEKIMSVEDQFSSKWMVKVEQSQSNGQPTNNNWEQSESDRLAMADAAAQAEIDANKAKREKQEATDAAAIEAVKNGAAPEEVEQEDASTVGTEPNEVEEVI